MLKVVDGEPVELSNEEGADIVAQQELDRDIAPPVPMSVSKLGLIRALRELGKWTSVKAAIAAHDEMQEDWDAAQFVSRVDPMAQAMIAQLGLDEKQVNALLIRATEIVA